MIIIYSVYFGLLNALNGWFPMRNIKDTLHEEIELEVQMGRKRSCKVKKVLQLKSYIQLLQPSGLLGASVQVDSSSSTGWVAIPSSRDLIRDQTRSPHL